MTRSQYFDLILRELERIEREYCAGLLTQTQYLDAKGHLILCGSEML